MANHKSALKRHRQNLKRRARNSAVKSAVRTSVKKARASVGVEGEDPAAAIKNAQVALARAGVKGVFHKRTVARRISRLALMQNKLAAGGPEALTGHAKSKSRTGGNKAKGGKKK